MIKNYLRLALRNFRKYKTTSVINVAGLAVGLAVCMLIMLWVADERSFDRFHVNGREIHRVYRDESATARNQASALTSPPMAAALKKDFPDILKATRFGTWQRRLVTAGDKSFTESRYMHADPDFFAMFSFPFLKGNPETAFAHPYSVVLTESAAAKFFGRDEPLGKRLTVDRKFDVVVTGVVRDVPAESSLEFDYLSPFELLLKEYIGEENRENWGFNSFSTFVLLARDVPGPELNRKLAGYLKKQNADDTDELALQPLADVHLRSRLGHDYRNVGDVKYVWIFSALALFVLAIAGVNFMNLTTARSANRAREVGLRKVVGAKRAQLVRQFFGESILTALIAFFFALILVEALLPFFNAISGKHLSSAWDKSLPLVLGFLGLALAAGVFSGSYPALFLSSLRPVQVLQGSRRRVGANPRFRKALVVFQFSLSVILIVGTVVIGRQLSFMRTKDLGFQRADIVRLELYGELANKWDTIRERFLTNPDVLQVTASLSLPTNIQNSPGTPEWEGKSPEEKMEIKADFVDYDYIETFGIPLVEGRSFSREFASDADDAYIVNEEAVRRMGLPKPAVGRAFGFWNNKGRIIGVMKDAHFQALHHKIEPLVFKIFPDWFRFMYVKIRPGDVSSILPSLEKTWAGLNLGYPFEARFLDDDFDRLYRTEARLGTLFSCCAVLAVFIACLGLFGLASFMAEQRTKEIGIRKVLGATAGEIGAMMLGEFAKWVGAANLIAWPLAYIIVRRWLAGFAYRIGLGAGPFLFAALLALVVAVLTVSVQSLKAALSDPADALRDE